ncbi:ABC transporter substrate-binding protein [Rhodococcus sp. NPDC003382]
MQRPKTFRPGPRRVPAVVAAVALLVAGCGGRSGTETGDSATSGSGRSAATSADFGDLTDVCQGGDASTATTQGVTAEQIEVGVFTDMGFTKNPEFVDAAKVFTSWCNDNGGINGRTLGVKERLNCLLPSFPAQAVQERSAGADLEVSASPAKIPGYDNYAGFRTWAVNEAYPDSKAAVGLINGDSAVTKIIEQMTFETLDAIGATVVYNELYPAMGVSDWTPYAQAIKNKGVKGLIFMGTWEQLAKLEAVLTDMDYKLDWIDPNNNAYNAQFIELLGRSADFQNNIVDLSGVAPLESDEPAVEQLEELYAKYAPDAQITLPAIRAWSSWLLFAKSAAACGDELTRKCVYETARQETAWTGGGLHAANDLQNPIPPQPCFNVEQATSEGWKPADFDPDNGPYRCDIPARKFTADFGTPMTLAEVGKTMDDVQ